MLRRHAPDSGENWLCFGETILAGVSLYYITFPLSSPSRSVGKIDVDYNDHRCYNRHKGTLYRAPVYIAAARHPH